MSSVINTNIAATRTHNVYNRNNVSMNQAMTRVATGMKINSAKDGASTWAISEKMLERIRANDQANQNVQNDQALLKTAQGGIGNTIDILKTLKERAVNAANDSNIGEDRVRIAYEVEQLVKQIDDNVEKVKFNGRTLLDGKYTAASSSVFTATPESGASSTEAVSNTAVSQDDSTTEATHAIFAQSTALLASNFKEYISSAAAINSAPTNMGGNLGDALLVNLLDPSTTAAKNSAVTSSDKIFNEGDVIKLSFKLDGTAYENTFTVEANSTLKDLLDGGLTGNGIKSFFGNAAAVTDSKGKTVYTATNGAASTTTTVGNTAANTWTLVGDKGKAVTDLQLTISGEDDSYARDKFFDAMFGSSDGTGNFSSTHFVYKETTATTASGLNFYVGGETGFSLTVGIDAMDSTTLGVSGLANAMLDQGTAEGAISTIDNALQTALNAQTKLGAWESRLGYTSDNLVTMNENLEAANSVMRDSDVAKEMTTYMRYAVLSQASQYMLAQAGQNAYQVLNLLNV